MLSENESFGSLEDQESNCTILNYLEGDGDTTWIPTSFESPLLQKLMKFRNVNMIGAQAHKMLTDIRALYDKTMLAMEDYKPDLLILLKLKQNVQIDFFEEAWVLFKQVRK
ncbi:hypothetical protein MBANPS3_011113 [Mucor bainieri]